MAAVALAYAWLPAAGIGAGEVRTYPPLPGGKYQSDRYRVSVATADSHPSSSAARGRRSVASGDCYVYQSANSLAGFPTDVKLMSAANHFAAFSFSGAVTVTIRLPLRGAVSTAVVRPLAQKVKATVQGNIISLNLDHAGNYCVIFDGEERHPLFLFANPLETDVPSPQGPNVLYYGPGIHDIGSEGTPAQNIPDGKSVYLAGGSYVRGVFKSAGREGLVIRGRGVLSGIDLTHRRHSPMPYAVDAGRGRVFAEGIIITDPVHYCIVGWGKGSVVDNVKFLGWHMTTDAVSLGVSSRVSNCFMKVNDDALKLTASGMQMMNNVVWIQMAGGAVQLGWNCASDVVDASVNGLDIIGSDRAALPPQSRPFVNSVVSLQNVKGAVYRGITISDVCIDIKPYQLFSLQIKGNNPAYAEGSGSVQGILFRNISVAGVPSVASRFLGNGTNSGEIRNVILDNVVIAGELLTRQNAPNYLVLDGKTSDFSYVKTDGTAKPAPGIKGRSRSR